MGNTWPVQSPHPYPGFCAGGEQTYEIPVASQTYEHCVSRWRHSDAVASLSPRNSPASLEPVAHTVHVENMYRAYDKNLFSQQFQKACLANMSPLLRVPALYCLMMSFPHVTTHQRDPPARPIPVTKTCSQNHWFYLGFLFWILRYHGGGSL